MCISPASHPKKNSKTSTTYLDSPRPNRAPAPRAFLSPTFPSFFLCSVAAAASSSALALLPPPPPSSSMFPLQKTCCRVCLYWQQNTGQVERRRRRCFTSSCVDMPPPFSAGAPQRRAQPRRWHGLHKDSGRDGVAWFRLCSTALSLFIHSYAASTSPSGTPSSLPYGQRPLSLTTTPSQVSLPAVVVCWPMYSSNRWQPYNFRHRLIKVLQRTEGKEDEFQLIQGNDDIR